MQSDKRPAVLSDAHSATAASPDVFFEPEYEKPTVPTQPLPLFPCYQKSLADSRCLREFSQIVPARNVVLYVCSTGVAKVAKLLPFATKV